MLLFLAALFCAAVCEGSTRLPDWPLLVGERSFLPLALVVLVRWPDLELGVVAMEGSEAGRDCAAIEGRVWGVEVGKWEIVLHACNAWCCVQSLRLAALLGDFGTLSTMKSNATTVKEYLASLPEDRRVGIEAVRKVILANLDKDYEEGMVYGMIGYSVPHRVWPLGYHCDPSKPLMMCALASQKNNLTVYLMSVYGGQAGTNGGMGNMGERAWFEKAWKATGKKLDMGGCCVRFKRVEDAALDVIGEAVARTPAKGYVENYVKILASTGRGPDGKKLKEGAKGKAVGKKGTKKVGKKKVVKKSGKKLSKKKGAR